MKKPRRKKVVGQERAILTVIEKIGPVALATIETEGMKPVWAVRGPDHFNQQQYWTQPDERSARSFARRLLGTLLLSNGKPTKGIERAFHENSI